MYSTNPYLPKLRRDVAYMAERKGIRATSRYFGIPPGTICKWKKKSGIYGYHPIPTLSSKPKHHPKELKKEMIQNIVRVRTETKRCAEVIHKTLSNEGVTVSLSSVKRTLDRCYLTKKKSPWKRLHFTTHRPDVLKPGDLLELDTIHLMRDNGRRIYVYTLIDVYTRWTYAVAVTHIGAGISVRFLREAQLNAPFKFNHIQTDNGPEFSSFFSLNAGVTHRHSRIRKPNDNAHIERFNRTIQEECLDGLVKTPKVLNTAIQKYLKYYNEKRLHFGINLQSPIQFLKSKCFQAID